VINVVGLALYGPMAASHRVRLGQYCRGLADAGINLKVQSLLGDQYLKSRFSGTPVEFLPIISAGFERVLLLFRKERFDAAIVQCELFPFVPYWLERMSLKVPYIYDFDDAWYLRYRVGKLAGLRTLLGEKTDFAIRDASAVTAGNECLASYARGFNGAVTLLPSAVDTARFVPTLKPKNPVFTVGWIGSPSTAPYLQSLVKPLQRFGKDRSIRLIVVGGSAPRIEGIEVIEVPWSEDKEVELINSFDIGVMPLPDDQWARGKCAFKLIQYMACGVPVVASRIGANIDLVTEDCGFLVSTPDEWVDAVSQFFEQPLMRLKMGAASRKRVIDAYSLDSNVPLFVNVIRKIVR
jgi:glycosyltransferase involved in cell wall biosynthesis